MLLTEIYQIPAKNHAHPYDFTDYEQIQKNNMMGQLYNQVSSYYQEKIDNGQYYISFGYITNEQGEEKALACIYDKISGEQVQ